MTFQNEAEMQRPARLWLEAQGLSTKAEFATPWGVCDLVGLSFNPRSVAKRLAHGQTQAIGGPSRVAILQEIPDQRDDSWITFQRLSRVFEHFVEPARLREELERLQRGRFVVSPRRNAYQRINGWLPLHKRIVAVELKLARLSDALGQASAHLAYATEAYVALPRPLALRAAQDYRAAQLLEAGVGLLAVGPDSCEVLKEPVEKRGPVDPVLQLACVDRFWRSHIKGSSS